METQSHHPGGEPCLAGKRKVPRGFAACCARFDRATQACAFDIRFEWWPRSKSWVVRIADGGSSGIEFSFCPYCGVNLNRAAAGKRLIDTAYSKSRKSTR
jgi:hypothetical protein